jgi:hypothetical protein
MILSVSANAASLNGNLYRAVLVNCFGNSTSSVGRLCTGSTPQVLSSPASVTAQAHGTLFTLTASFNVSVIPPVNRVVWERTSNSSCCWSSTLPNGVSFSTDFGTGVSTLTFLGNSSVNLNANFFRAVFYNCLPSALASAASSPGFICQGAAPVISSPLAVSTVYGLTGRSVRLQATASGSPTLSAVAWTTAASDADPFSSLPSGPEHNVSGSFVSSVLDVLASPSLNGAAYRATFSNCLSSNTSVSFLLCVGDAPTIVSNPQNVSIETRAVTSFQASATGVPPVTGVIWEVSGCATCSWSVVANSSAGFYSITGFFLDIFFFPPYLFAFMIVFQIGPVSNSTLTLTNGTYGNGFRYRASFFNCLRTGLGVLTQSTPATLCTGSFPNVTSQPRPQLVASPRNVSFTATATFSPLATSVGWDISSPAGDAWISVDQNPLYQVIPPPPRKEKKMSHSFFSFSFEDCDFFSWIFPRYDSVGIFRGLSGVSACEGTFYQLCGHHIQFKWLLHALSGFRSRHCFRSPFKCYSGFGTGFAERKCNCLSINGVHYVAIFQQWRGQLDDHRERFEWISN